ncbi:hypothetical protein OS493_039921 [Desmophyllum pertusum]|uniref:Uncharacterized protein n=1 Tax=Desmophyllum pertusum TaxID=174260 RepID=A0A9W9ZUH3_9CNID|nr:hypothetical protein OS493_039921 [Desmophyllum pertusum]
MSRISERFPASLPLMGATKYNEYGAVELRVLNQDSAEMSNETGRPGREPWNADLLEKRTAQVFKVLQLLGLVVGDRSRRFGHLFILLTAVITWVPPTFLSICVANNPAMSSPSGLPTVLLFSGLALSHHFGALYGYRHRGRLRRNVYLAIERANFCRNVSDRDGYIWNFDLNVSCSTCLLPGLLLIHVPLYWAAMVTVKCTGSVNGSTVHGYRRMTRPLGHFNIASLDSSSTGFRWQVTLRSGCLVLT